MLVQFYFALRASGVPVSISEFLTLLEALGARMAQLSPQQFYYLARTCLVKDERHYDRFDRVFAQVFHGAEQLFAQLLASVPPEWLASLTARVFSAEEQRRVAALGGWQQLLETLRGFDLNMARGFDNPIAQAEAQVQTQHAADDKAEAEAAAAELLSQTPPSPTHQEEVAPL